MADTAEADTALTSTDLTRIALTNTASEIAKRLEALADPARAESSKAYLKSDLDFIGVRVPDITRTVKDALKAGGVRDHDEAVALARELWSQPVFELRAAAAEALSRCVDQLGSEDLPLLQNFVRESGTWALVDPLATAVLSRMVERHAGAHAAELDRWAEDEDFWVRRASLLAELRPARRGDKNALDRFFARAEPLLEEREFFVRKAIGWVLREAGKAAPERVAAWLAPRAARASGVTMREAVKYLAESDRERLLAAYRVGSAGGRRGGR